MPPDLLGLVLEAIESSGFSLVDLDLSADAFTPSAVDFLFLLADLPTVVSPSGLTANRSVLLDKSAMTSADVSEGLLLVFNGCAAFPVDFLKQKYYSVLTESGNEILVQVVMASFEALWGG